MGRRKKKWFSPTFSNALELVKAKFNKTYEKTGVALTAEQLFSYAKKNKINEVSLFDVAKFLTSHPVSAKFGRVDRVKHFQTIGVPRSGMYQIDYGEFHKEWARHNGGSTGFLIAVENFTNRLFAIPCRGKGTQEWLNAIAKFVELTRDVRIIYTDRDSVATSTKFRTQIVDKYGIEWYFLKKGNKSYLAERYVGFVKKKLSQALNSQLGFQQPKNWSRFLEPICSEYNSQKIRGTSYSRQGVSRKSFDHFVRQLLKISPNDDYENGFVAGPFKNKKWNKKIFKFDLGAKVLVARRANWKFDKEKLKPFTKISAEGGFGESVYTVSGRQLRANKNRTEFIPVYSLDEFQPHFHFYEKELKLAPN